ncbi:MAG: ABC transporter substrate-binding protein, partial [Phyllobacteriaceae bacterium]|nr:ABC transporter substrate-binding protein [Phyllobacteriaceae bacterium]
MPITLSRRNWIASALATAVFAAAGRAAKADAPIKIGAFLSITGPAAFLGDPELKTLQLFIDHINAKGGVLGRSLSLVSYDDGGDAAKANGFVKRLIESDGVDVLIGGTTTGTTMAVVPMIERAEIPFISLAGGIVVVEPVKKWVFKTPGSDRFSIARIFDDMKKRGITKLALLTETSGLGQSSKAEATKLVGQYGLTIVADEAYGPKDIDTTAQLTRIRNSNAEAVAVFGFGQGPAIVTKNYAQLGLKQPLYQTHGVAAKEFIALVGSAGEGVRLSSPALIVVDDLPASDPQKAVLVAYRDAYKAKYGEDPATFG